jgi:fibronectin type 3 domain-containing protein
MPLLLLVVLAGCGKSGAGSSSKPHSVTLTWKASVSKVSNYHVYRTTDPSTQPGLLAVAPADATQYVDSTVESGRTYYYSIKSVGLDGTESIFSDKISATVPRD